MNHAVRLLLFINGIYAFALAMFGPIYAIFVADIGGDILAASGAWAAFSIVAGVVTLIIGKLEDRLKETELAIVFGDIIIALGFWSYMFVESPASLLWVQVLIGLGVAFGSPAYDAVFSRHLDHKRETFEWGTWEAIHMITSGLGALFGGIVATLAGFTTLFFLMGLLSLGSAVIVLITPRKVL